MIEFEERSKKHKDEYEDGENCDGRMLGNNDIFIASRSTINISLSIYYCGSEEFSQGAQWGPKVVDHFVLYYIYEGKGILNVGNRTYALKAGDGFLVPKDVLTGFTADKKNPLKAVWVGFYGYLAEGYLKRCHLTKNHPIFCYNDDDFFYRSFHDMIQISKRKHNRYCNMMAILYDIIGKLIDITSDHHIALRHSEPTEMYLRKALEFVDMNYSKKVSVQDISDHVGVDRKYLHKIFKDILDKSPQTYLIEYRVKKACELLKTTELSVANISLSVGYNDVFHFSKIFKRVMDVSPSGYRLRYELSEESNVVVESTERQPEKDDDTLQDQKAVIMEMKSVIAELKHMMGT